MTKCDENNGGDNMENKDITTNNNNNTNNIMSIMKENYTWIIGVLTFLGIMVNKVLELIEHITSQVYFSYYGLNRNLYNYTDKGFIYDLVVSIIFMLAFISIFICIKQLKEQMGKGRIINLENLRNVGLIVLSNLFIDKTISEEINCFKIITLILIEIIFFYVSTKEFKTTKQRINFRDNLKTIMNYIKIIPCFVILMIILYSCSTFLKLQNRTYYNIIDNNKVVVYTSNDYYLTLDCDINGDEILIHKGKQEKIGNNNIKTQLTKFSKVQIQDIN